MLMFDILDLSIALSLSVKYFYLKILDIEFKTFLSNVLKILQLSGSQVFNLGFLKELLDV